MSATGTSTVAPQLDVWLTENTGAAGPWQLSRLTGGNSNETYLVRGARAEYVLRKPPERALSPSAHAMSREYRVLAALAESPVPAPAPIALCEETEIPLAPFLLMEHIPDAVSITDHLPDRYGPQALTAVADELVDALVAIHQLDWRALGIGDLGRPEGFLERQVRRWYGQWQGVARRPLAAMHRLAEWLERNRPPCSAPALMHGDFHLDNCLYSVAEPRALAVVDWEMATIGDPLLDLGLLLALWGDRAVAPPGMPFVQAVSRLPEAPAREYLLSRYEARIGTRVQHVGYYQCLALFKLSAIVEAAWSQHVAGELDTPYAAALEYDVPALLAEAEAAAGIG